MPKIFLSPPYHYWNQCCYNSTCNETDHGNAYCDELQKYLEACGFDIKRGARRVPKSSEDGTKLMYQAVADSNAWGADLHYITHSNASNGSVKGSRPMWCTGSLKGKAIVDKIIQYRKQIYPYDIIPHSTTEWYELRTTKCPAVYEELVFHDNTEDAAWFHSNMRLMAEYTCRAFCDYFGITFVDPYVGVTQPVQETPISVTRNTLKVGNSGSDVTYLQTKLNGLKSVLGMAFANLSVDGIFGNMTLVAVKEFQSKCGLTVDGIVGVNTWGALEKDYSAPVVVTPEPVSEPVISTPEVPTKTREEVVIPTVPATPQINIPGDINGDGKITAADALIALQASVSKIKLTDEQKVSADINGDGNVGAADSLKILQSSVGK